MLLSTTDLQVQACAGSLNHLGALLTTTQQQAPGPVGCRAAAPVGNLCTPGAAAQQQNLASYRLKDISLLLPEWLKNEAWTKSSTSVLQSKTQG